SSIFSIIVAVGMMLKFNWHLTLLISVVSPVIYVATKIFYKKAMEAYRLLRRRLSRITANVAENISGIRVVQAFCREKLNLLGFRDLSQDFTNVAIRASLVWFVYFPIIGLMYAVATVIILVFGGRLIVAGTLTIGELGAFVLLLRQFFGPIEWLGHIYNESLHGAAAAERIFDLLDTPPEVKDKEGALEIKVRQGNVEFNDVCFSYNAAESDGDVLHSINFNVRAGEKLAVVGKTGAGKTSIVNLLIKFYEPQKGSIVIDGYDTSNVKTKSLRSNMAIVPQDNFLFSGTVMENLVYIERKVTEDDVIDAAKKLGSHDVIMNLGDGYNTQVKERGAGLSLGERQLICFTRALLSDPEILVLDEATSAVDSQTEKKLQHALQELTEGRTSIIIAHRLSTIKKADKILVVDNGKIVETGKHHELIKNGGMYSNLYKEYLSTG
ncbi:ABC transporter ATP-binding protein/permease, partial [bacterium]|nr:ABC transporter ATP-binding protein/permease [bacterium]